MPSGVRSPSNRPSVSPVIQTSSPSTSSQKISKFQQSPFLFLLDISPPEGSIAASDMPSVQLSQPSVSSSSTVYAPVPSRLVDSNVPVSFMYVNFKPLIDSTMSVVSPNSSILLSSSTKETISNEVDVPIKDEVNDDLSIYDALQMFVNDDPEPDFSPAQTTPATEELFSFLTDEVTKTTQEIDNQTEIYTNFSTEFFEYEDTFSNYNTDIPEVEAFDNYSTIDSVLDFAVDVESTTPVEPQSTAEIQTSRPVAIDLPKSISQKTDKNSPKLVFPTTNYLPPTPSKFVETTTEI